MFHCFCVRLFPMKQNSVLEEKLSQIIAFIIVGLYAIVLFIASLQHGIPGFLLSIGILYFMLFGRHTKA